MHFIGIDVSKAKLDCCLLLDVASDMRKAKTFANSRTGIVRLLEWCAKQHVAYAEIHAIMEATGVYYEQAATALHDAGCHRLSGQPRLYTLWVQPKDFGRSLGIRTKTDGVDSLVPAKYSALTNSKLWLPLAQEARGLQALLSRREAIAQYLRRERNRLEKTDATDTPESIR